MATHTPGPWRLVDLRHQQRGQILVSGSAQDVANVLARNAEAEANARLIAAAPELLAALKDMLPYVESCIERSGCPASKDTARIKTAIAKAEGR